jgi:hypothetical protein
VRPDVSVESADLEVIQGLGGGGLSTAYWCVSARLQYGCSRLT